ncbi:MAG: carbon storage regulator [Peptococcaceae bacterium]|nr:MAG: carbon storage regulator [Peptococcaceae bacterium]
MLVLARKKNESIMLGNDIRIVILEINDDGVRVGIEAPKDVTILRSELYQAVKEENVMAIVAKRGMMSGLKDLLKESKG